MRTKLQNQIGKECALASIAMLTGKPLELIRRRAYGRAGLVDKSTRGWDEFIRHAGSDAFWDTIAYLVKFYGLEDSYIAHSDHIPTMANVPVRYGDVTEKAPRLRGRGQFVYSGTGWAHSIVVDDGMAFDANLKAPMAWNEYWQTVVLVTGAYRWQTKLDVIE